MAEKKSPIMDIVVVGAGGTGSYFLKEFSRYLYDNRAAKKKLGNLVIIDGDRVEKKNIKRQAFQEDDVELPKAAVLASALTEAFGASDWHWDAYTRYVLDVETLEGFFRKDHIPVLIGCVDNHGARVVFEKFFKKCRDIIYIDSANEFSMGEVVVACKNKGRRVSMLRSEVFPDMLSGDLRNVEEMSCTELNEVAPQHITANMTAGLTILNVVTNLFENGRVAAGMVVFDAQRMSMKYYSSSEEVDFRRPPSLPDDLQQMIAKMSKSDYKKVEKLIRELSASEPVKEGGKAHGKKRKEKTS